MPPSTTSFFPDINVWVALTYEGHVHHAVAAAWFAKLQPDEALAFCRFTQLGLLRLLTTAAVMGDELMTQLQAWAAYDRWLQDPRVEFVDEPSENHASVLSRAVASRRPRTGRIHISPHSQWQVG